ncbi:MAG: hypothetical protein PUH70_12145 [Clostridiales bacterium]|nr:hypothetical protein [Clostridiales bacterium]MDY5514821.1 hypothetical protein [Candidatus Ventricola sp.]
MGETISNKIVLEGEAEYKRALADINSRLRENKSAMKAAAAEYDAAGDSMEAMYRYGDSLERTMASQNEALGLMSEHLEKVEACYGKNSREANELRTKINNMRTELAKTQTQMRQFESSMDAASTAGDDLKAGMDAGSAGLEQVGEAAGRANEDVQELSQSIADTMGKKIIDFVIAGKAFDTLKDGLSQAVTWAIGEGVDGLRERGYMQSGTGDVQLTEARMDVKDQVDRLWSGRMDGMATAAAVETVDTVMDNLSQVMPRTVAEVTNAAIFQQERFGASISEQMQRADAMVKTFGVDWMDAFDLMTLGFQNSHDGGEMMLRMFDENAQVFRQMGYDADDMFSTILAAVNNEELGKDSNLNKGMMELISTVTDGSKESLDTLKALGIEAKDIGIKAQQGGETAAAAYQLVLEQLLSVEDVAKRNELGAALFGDTVWTATGGDIASALLAGFGQTIETEGVTQAAMDALLDNIGDSWAGLKERMGQQAGEATEGLVQAANDFVKDVNEQTDRLGGDVLKGASQAAANLIEGKVEDIKDEGNRLMDATADLYAQLEALDEQINNAWMSGDNVEALTLEAQKQQLIDEIATVKQEVMDGFGEVGTEAASSLEDKAEDMRTAGETLTDEAVGAVTDAQGDMQSAADSLGQSGVTGLEDALADMRGASEDAVDGAVAELYGGVSRAYAAGQATGKAYARGYKSALSIKSPSRVMREAAKDTVSPLFDEFEQDRARLYEAAAGLAQAVSEGYGDSAALRAEVPQGGAQAAGGASVETMAQAMRQAMSGMAFELDGNRFAVLIEPGVSRATQQRAMATVRGQGAAARSW